MFVLPQPHPPLPKTVEMTKGWLVPLLNTNDPKFWDMSHNAAAIISTITALVS